MAVNTKAKFMMSITPFSGDPELLDFFIEQVNDKIQLSNLSDKQALILIKSKLSEQALKFYASSAICKKATSPHELFNIFKKQFVGETSNSIALQFNAISFNEGEDIRKFAHRLDTLVRKRFPDLSENAVEQILMAKFKDLIPMKYKLHLLSHKLENFYAMVDILTTIQELFNASSELPSSSVPTSLIHHFSAQHNNNQSCNLNDKGSSADSQPNSVNVQNPVFNVNASVPESDMQQSQIVCQWCKKPGHSAHACFQLRKSMNARQGINHHSSQSIHSLRRNFVRHKRAGQRSFNTHAMPYRGATRGFRNSNSHPKFRPRNDQQEG